MQGRNAENLERLVDELVARDQAQQVLDDIRAGDELFARDPGPQPSPQLIEEIKARVAANLDAGRTGTFKRTVRRVTAAAAVLAVAAAVYIAFLRTGPADYQEIPPAVWDSTNLAADDPELAAFKAEMDQLENQLLALQLGEDFSQGFDEAAEIESELTDISAEFWKG